VLAIGLGAVLAAAVSMAPATATSTATATTDDAIVIWDGDTDQIIQVEDELFGRLVVVPGSHHQRTLRIQNAGPSEGVLTVAIVNAVAHTGGDGWVDDSFYDDLMINEFPASTLDGAETPITTVVLDQGATTTVTFDVDFPWEATSGNAAEVGERLFSFDVRLNLSGDTSDQQTPTPSPTGSGSGSGGKGTTTSGTKPAGTSGLASQTGGIAAELNVPLLLAAAAAVAAAATLTLRALATARRRRAMVTVRR
jgi:hypothetical protein